MWICPVCREENEKDICKNCGFDIGQKGGKYLSVTRLTAAILEKYPVIHTEGFEDYDKGCRYYFGIGTPMDIGQAIGCWTRAARAGYGRAACRLADCFWQGAGVDRDREEALRWWIKGAKDGDAEAMAQLALHGSWLHQPRSQYQVRTEQYLAWGKRAAENGYEQVIPVLEKTNTPYAMYDGYRHILVCNDTKQGCFALGHMYLTGRIKGADGVDPVQKAVYWLSRSAQKAGRQDTANRYMMEIAESFRNGSGVGRYGQELDQARKLLAGIGGRKGPAEGLRMLEEIAASSSPKAQDAMCELGRFFAGDYGKNADWEQAAVWFGQAAKGGHAYSRLRFLEITDREERLEPDVWGKRYEQAVRWCEETEAAGNADAAALLGSCHLERAKTKKDLDKAMILLKKGAKAGSGEACERIGDLYRIGYESMAGDLEMALRWYKKAADLGSAYGKDQIRNWGYYLDEKLYRRYMAPNQRPHGQASNGKYHSGAVRLLEDIQFCHGLDLSRHTDFKRALERISPKGDGFDPYRQFMTGLLYWRQKTVCASYGAKAVRHFEAGLAGGCPLAGVWLSRAYRFGVGTEKNLEKAKELEYENGPQVRSWAKDGNEEALYHTACENALDGRQELARKQFEKAFEGGCIFAAAGIARYAYEDFCREKDRIRRLLYFEKACCWYMRGGGKGDVNAVRELGRMLLKLPDQKGEAAGISWLERASETGDRQSDLILMKLYEKRYDKEKERGQRREDLRQKAMTYGHRACQTDNPILLGQAKSCLDKLYSDGNRFILL